MQEIYMRTSLGFLAVLGVLLAHAYVLVRFGLSPALALSLMMSVGGVASQTVEAGREIAPPPVAVEGKAAEPDLKPDGKPDAKPAEPPAAPRPRQ